MKLAKHKFGVLLLVLVGLLCPVLSGQEAEQTVSVSALMGTVVTTTSDVEAGLVPFMALQATVPTAKSFYAPSLVVTPILTGLPGSSVVGADPKTYKAIELGLGVQQHLARPLNLSLYGEFGAASLLGTKSTGSNDRSSRWLIGGIRTSGEHGQLVVGVGADERLSGRFVPAVVIQGVLKTPMRIVPGDMALVGSIVLNVGSTTYGYVGSDIFRVGIAFGGGN